MYKFQCCQCCHSIILTSTLIWASQENFAKQHLIGLQCATAQVKDSASDLLQFLLEYKKFFRHISELFQVRISDNDVAAYNFFSVPDRHAVASRPDRRSGPFIVVPKRRC